MRSSDPAQCRPVQKLDPLPGQLLDPFGILECGEPAAKQLVAPDAYVDGASASSASRWPAHRALRRANISLGTARRGKAAPGALHLLVERLSLMAERLHLHDNERLGIQPGQAVGEPAFRPGHPSLAYLVGREFRQRTFGQLTALRVGCGLILAGVATTLVGTEHFYWSIVTAGVILHIRPNRAASVERAVHRSLGTFAGVGLVALMTLWMPPAPVELSIVILGAFGMNLFLAHHYALAIARVTPRSLMVTNVMSPGLLAGLLIQDRIIETVIGAAAAFLATALFSTRGLQTVVRGQLRGTASTIGHLIDALEQGGERRPATARLMRSLAFELDATGTAVRRASVDVPGLWDLAVDESALVDLGYDTLVAAHDPARDTPSLRDRLVEIPRPPRRR